MKPVKDFNKKIKILFTDIDDTLTLDGKLIPESYSSLWELQKNNIQVIPITGRPAGWCEMIARFWPVEGVIGENGAFYFRYKNNRMNRVYYKPPESLQEDLKKLEQIKIQVLNDVPGCAVSTDQFCRMYDLAIDFCEDVKPLNSDAVKKIVHIFNSHGATAKVSSIHVNGWFGDFNKLKMALHYLKTEHQMTDPQTIQNICAFAGDSPNDEPMFEFFENSFAVANIKEFISDLKTLPHYVSNQKGGLGFKEISDSLLKIKNR